MTENQPSVIRGFYDEQAKDDFAEHYKTVPFYFKAMDFLKQAINDGLRPFARLLDVGCGPGHLTAGLPGSVQVVGIDLAEKMLEKASVARPIGRYFVHDFHDRLPESEGQFDIIFASGAFDLCNDIGKALSALSGSLQANGLFYFTVLEHRPGTPNNGDREINGRPKRPEPILLHFFSFQEVSAALAQAGLAPLSYQYAEGWKSRTLSISFDYGYWVAVKKPAAKPQ